MSDIHYEWHQDVLASDRGPSCLGSGTTTVATADVTCLDCQERLAKVMGNWLRRATAGDAVVDPQDRMMKKILWPQNGQTP